LHGGVRDFSKIKGRVEVNTTQSRGKNKWQAALRSECLRMLDPSIQLFSEQEPQHLASVCKTMRGTWEYIDSKRKPAPIAQECFDNIGGRIMKTEWQALKSIFDWGGGFKGKKVPPPYRLSVGQ
jgi:hypothetical protein